MNPPRILLSAYQCAPGQGSVSQIGWEWYSRLVSETSVTLVTHSRNRKHLEAAGAPLDGSEIIYIDTEWFAGPLYWLVSSIFGKNQHAIFLFSSLDFFLYDFVTVRKLRSRRNCWDVTHAVTPVSPLAATRLYTLGPPLVVGPWNGGLKSPPEFGDIIQDDGGWIYGLRALGQAINLFSGCAQKAARVLAATQATANCLPQQSRSERMLENGVDLSIFKPADDVPLPSPTNPLQILFVGRLVPIKGISMLLEAVHRIRDHVPVRLTIIGDGPLRQKLSQEVILKRLELIVTFTGQETLERIARYMRRSHLFCLPSVRESGGAVLLEAMASGLPVLGVNHGGPSELVDEEVGRALSAEGPEQLIASMVDVFEDVARRPEEWRKRGKNGRRRAEQSYGWPARIQRAFSIYQKVLEERS